MTVKKKFLIALGSLLAAFALVNIVWGVYVCVYLNRYTKSFPVDENSPSYSQYKEGFTYSATKVKYLDFTNNLAIVDEHNENGLIIWKTLTGTEYGVTFSMSNGQEYQMYVDKDGKPTGNKNLPDAEQVYQENEEIIRQMMGLAKIFWNLK